MGTFFQSVQDLLRHLLRLRVLQSAQIVLGLSPCIVQFTLERSKAGVAEQNASLLMQIQTQFVNRPNMVRQTRLLRVSLQRYVQLADIFIVRFGFSSRFEAVLQACNAFLPPAAMLRPDGVGCNGDHFCYLLRLVSQVEQTNRYRSLPYLKMGRIIDGLLNFSKLLWVQGEVDSSAYTNESSSFVDFLRLLA